MTRLRFLVPAVVLSLVVSACGDSDPAATTEAVTGTTDTGSPWAGAWFGLVPPGARIQLQLAADPDGGLTGVFDSIEDGVMGLTLEDLAVSDRVLEFSVGKTGISGSFELETGGDRMVGALEADGDRQEVILIRRDEPFAFDRPQHPEPPFPYASEEVRFPGGNGDYSLAGTLTLPEGEGPFPAVLLISGSGPQDRDEQLAGHRPFLVLSDHLTRAGLAVLRYDDPGYGESGGSLEGTTADLADDAAAAFRYLEGRPETATTGLLGHSEGGLIAPMVAAAEPAVAFAVLLAGPATSGAAVLAEQTALVMEAEGVEPLILDWQMELTGKVIAASASGLDDPSLETELARIAAEAVAAVPASLAGALSAEDIAAGLTPYQEPWMRFFLSYDPAPTLAALDIPVLALLGSVDLQVPAASNVGPMTGLLTHPASEVEVIDGVNHLFQQSETGRVSEYADLTETMAPMVLERVTAWILSVVG